MLVKLNKTDFLSDRAVSLKWDLKEQHVTWEKVGFV